MRSHTQLHACGIVNVTCVTAPTAGAYATTLDLGVNPAPAVAIRIGVDMLLFKRWDAGGASVASLLRRRRQVAKLAQKAELQQWESEGGTPAPPGATDTIGKTGAV